MSENKREKERKKKRWRKRKRERGRKGERDRAGELVHKCRCNAESKIDTGSSRMPERHMKGRQKE